MDCKEMILSEDTYDIITDFSASEFLGDDNNCYERIGEDFLILYLGNLGIRNPKRLIFSPITICRSFTGSCSYLPPVRRHPVSLPLIRQT